MRAKKDRLASASGSRASLQSVVLSQCLSLPLQIDLRIHIGHAKRPCNGFGNQRLRGTADLAWVGCT
jgi:hypothetical protein